ncbi:TraR/DksA family transcriptional regulator [Streptomyces sp. BK022]|uniref:TraR/DksA family transcriptional regulator n=1 Tax=Streptomyces sp. BK022 TaxID=2512123 RepID=UPI001028FF53|nr:TraR/DksA family transcriptional regulator [Streptomyces sp. BK022]RZU37957.1 TraR/DksA family transcriptional regulator [Streptomyces sp. BK022]
MVAKKTSGGSAERGSGRPGKADKAVDRGAAEKRAAGEKRVSAAKKTTRAKRASAERTAGEKTGGETVTPGKTAAKATAAEAATPQGTTADSTAPGKTAAKKTAAGKTAARKTASGTTAAKTPAKKLAAKKTAGKKAVAKKTATKKTAARKAPAKKTVAEKAAGTSTAEETGATRVVAKKTSGTATAEDGALPGTRLAAAEPGDLAVRPGEDPWTPEEVAEARAELAAEADRLRTEISTSEASLVGMMRDSADGAGDDEADTGSKNITREHELALAANAREMLSQTERALERMDAGTYGLCENCGNPIGKARMQAFPRATLCVECKQKQERRS